MDSLLTWLKEIFTDWTSGLGNLIGDLGIDDILSNIVGIIPRTIMYVRSIFSFIYYFFDSIFGIYSALLMFTVVGFIVILALRRGVFK